MTRREERIEAFKIIFQNLFFNENKPEEYETKIRHRLQIK